MFNYKKYKLIFLATVFLFAIFISQRIFIFQDYSPTVIIENNKFQNNPKKDLYQGDKINGEFTALHNNLGIVSVKFDTHWNINTDFLQFSIKEKGQSTWYYSNKYKVDQFQNKQYFPFGFPQINNSKNKIYEVKIESLFGTSDNSVTPSPNNEPFLTKYNFPKNYLLQNKNTIPTFLFNKIGSFFRHIEITSYILMLITVIIINLFLKSKIWQSKTSSSKNENPIFYWYFWALGLVYLLSLAIIIIEKHTESAEWLAYELSAIISFLTLIKLNVFNKKIKDKTIKNTLILGIIFIIAQLIFFKFYIEIISWRYILIASLALIPAITYNNHSTEKFFKLLLINLFSIVCVSGYFILDIDSYPIGYFLILLSSVPIVSFVITRKKVSLKSVWLKIICYLSLLIYIIFLVSKPIDFHHYSYYIGPAYEISQHKSILTQVPSQYGYLSIHFIKNILSPFGINFSTFHQLNVLLYAIYFVCIFFIIQKIVRNIFVATFFSFIAISFQSIFSIESAVLYPSSGPLRFGFGTLIILLTLYLKNNKKILIPTLLSSIVIFWSTETAIYIIPAWIFAVICNNFIHISKFKKVLNKTIKHLSILFGFTLLIFVIIFLTEWSHTKSIPNVLNYFQFANVYKNGYGSELMPKFGNYYIVIAILLLGLTLSIYSTFNKVKNELVLTLNFISIHNIAIFSYFISRSNLSNIINISIFLLIELILCYKIIEYILFKNNTKNLLKIIIFPVVLFSTFFILRCFDNTLHPNNLHQNVQNTPLFLESYKNLSQDYKLNPDNVLIISKDNSTQIITEFKIKTILPLNPTTMTTLLPNYEKKYLIPNVNKLSIGTTLIYTKDIPELISFFEKYFTLKSILSSDINSPFDIFVLEKKLN